MDVTASVNLDRIDRGIAKTARNAGSSRRGPGGQTLPITGLAWRQTHTFARGSFETKVPGERHFIPRYRNFRVVPVRVQCDATRCPRPRVRLFSHSSFPGRKRRQRRRTPTSRLHRLPVGERNFLPRDKRGRMRVPAKGVVGRINGASFDLGIKLPERKKKKWKDCRNDGIQVQFPTVTAE